MNLLTTEYRNPSHYFRRRTFFILIFLFLIVNATVLSVWHTGFKTETAITSIPRVVVWIFSNMFPDARALSRLPNILEKLVDTIFMSIMATTTAALLSLPFAIMGSRSTQINGFFSVISRGIASISRNIPVAAWAMIFLITFGMSSFTGYLALFFSTFGFLTRAFMETIDECSNNQVEALRASGATYSHVIAQAVIPASVSQMTSWILYMVETNIRDATLVGLLTGSGIGFLFDLYYKTMQYKSASLVVIILVVIVLLIEFISNTVRRKIL